MLKKLLILFAIVAFGAVSYGIVRAYFSSQEPATSQATFTAGTISINIESDGTNAVPFSMTNWMPGQTQKVQFNVKNTSTVPVTLSGEINGTWGEVLGDQKVYVIGAEYWDGGAWQNLDSPGHGTFTYAGPVGANGGVVTMRMTAQFDPTAGNEFQGQTYTADLFVTAHQLEE